MLIKEKFYKFNNNFIDGSIIFKNYLSVKSNYNIGVLDIETTGLSPNNTNFILGCIGTYTKNGFLSKQFFAESVEEEKKVLQNFISEFIKYDFLITFNGKRFDMNFIAKRAEYLGIKIDSPLPYNLDLYVFIQKYSSLKSLLPNLKQKTIENFMGLKSSRDDKISGAESISLYFEYCKTKNPNILDKILLHNSDDVLQLSKIISILSKCNIEEAFFNEGFASEYFLFNKISISNSILEIHGIQKNGISYIFHDFNSSLKVELSSENNSLYISIPLNIISNCKIVDLSLLNIDTSKFDNYESFSSNLLAIKIGKNICYEECILLVKEYTDTLYKNISKI